MHGARTGTSRAAAIHVISYASVRLNMSPVKRVCLGNRRWIYYIYSSCIPDRCTSSRVPVLYMLTHGQRLLVTHDWNWAANNVISSTCDSPCEDKSNYQLMDNIILGQACKQCSLICGLFLFFHQSTGNKERWHTSSLKGQPKHLHCHLVASCSRGCNPGFVLCCQMFLKCIASSRW